MIASARMYSWSPSLTAAWRRLLEWVSARAGVPLEVMDQSAPTSLDELWHREDLGCAFMCGYPWALYEKKPHLLAAPVPSPARYGGRPVYVTDFIVRADGPHRALADTFPVAGSNWIGMRWPGLGDLYLGLSIVLSFSVRAVVPFQLQSNTVAS